eukprot:CAMPEP_0168493688 /NCGR_PEP_ID=MMETSP0228-20121227/70847_1 /TAXON_ID=133427 /ORGANISM="Protoceratium reticulatum, Strain CCCM 535 (=CCMP 1889)" /LENGTH=221 /DNA_ID=CAMNT_0008510477 /DNA_START=227 /DNA_END=888 /DNA_ORIENTATION=+
MVATALAASTALSRETSGSPARICASDPTNASPAPVVSTTCSFSSLGHFTCVAPSGPQTRAPCAPMEISTCLQPLSWRTFAAAMASSSLLQGMPVRSSVSLWFGQMMSTSLYISSGRGTAGAGVKRLQRPVHGGLELRQDHASLLEGLLGSGDLCLGDAAVGPGHDHDVVLTAAHADLGHACGLRLPLARDRQVLNVDANGLEVLDRVPPEGVASDLPNHR